MNVNRLLWHSIGVMGAYSFVLGARAGDPLLVLAAGCLMFLAALMLELIPKGKT